MSDKQMLSGEEAALAGNGELLASYGDVPVAYAVFRVILNDDATEVVDTEYVYVNQEYRNSLDLGDVDLIGKSFLETVKGASDTWFPYCYRAAVLHEGSHDTIYSPETDSWLAFNVEPTPVEGCCIFAFTNVNAEHRRHELLESALDTSDFIITIANALNSELSYDDAMNAMLESMSKVIHPERLYIFERWETTSDNTFEWCAPGVEPEIELLQNLDNSEFETWDRMLATDSVVVIPDVSAYKGVDDRLYELLTMQGIDRLLAVPFYDRGTLIGYLGADNYALDEHLDTRRLLETVASFVCARMVNRRLMDELERLSIHDSLTGLLNRRGIDAAIDAHIKEHEGEPFALALIDIDDFKTVNDLYGHAVGDEALRVLAANLRKIMPEEAILGRNGGDEALVMLHGEDEQRVEELLGQLVQGKILFEMGNACYKITLSVGYSRCSGTAEDLAATYAEADAALYSVKYTGKAGFRRFTPGMGRYRTQRGFASRNVAEYLPEAVVVLQEETSEILFANEAMVDLLNCESLHDFMAFAQGALVNLIHPDDFQRVSESIVQLKSKKLHLCFRLLAKGGSAKSIAFSSHCIDMGDGRHAVYAVLFDQD